MVMMKPMETGTVCTYMQGRGDPGENLSAGKGSGIDGHALEAVVRLTSHRNNHFVEHELVAVHGLSR